MTRALTPSVQMAPALMASDDVCQCSCCQRARARFTADPHQLALFADAAPLIAFTPASQNQPSLTARPGHA